MMVVVFNDSTVIFLTGMDYTMSDLVIIPSGTTSITLDLKLGDLDLSIFNVYFNGVLLVFRIVIYGIYN